MLSIVRLSGLKQRVRQAWSLVDSELKRRHNMMLQKNLIETEERIAWARGYVNETTTSYTTRLEAVPAECSRPLLTGGRLVSYIDDDCYDL
jgi:hypothetical protein